jgi:hypothetical protein
MVKIALNLDEVQVFGEDNFPLGKHRAQVSAIEETESQAGNPMLTWDWAGADQESQGGTIRTYTVLTDNALGQFKMHVEAFGYSGDTEVETDDIVGKFAILTVAMRKRRGRDGDGEERLTVINIEPDTAPARRNGAAPAASGARRIGGGAAAPARPAAGVRRPAPAAEADDLPF